MMKIGNNDEKFFLMEIPIINERILQKHLHINLETKQGNLLWEIFEIMSKISF